MRVEQVVKLLTGASTKIEVRLNDNILEVTLDKYMQQDWYLVRDKYGVIVYNGSDEIAACQWFLKECVVDHHRLLLKEEKEGAG